MLISRKLKFETSLEQGPRKLEENSVISYCRGKCACTFGCRDAKGEDVSIGAEEMGNRNNRFSLTCGKPNFSGERWRRGEARDPDLKGSRLFLCKGMLSLGCLLRLSFPDSLPQTRSKAVFGS